MACGADRVTYCMLYNEMQKCLFVGWQKSRNTDDLWYAGATVAWEE